MGMSQLRNPLWGCTTSVAFLPGVASPPLPLRFSHPGLCYGIPLGLENTEFLYRRERRSEAREDKIAASSQSPKSMNVNE